MIDRDEQMSFRGALADVIEADVRPGGCIMRAFMVAITLMLPSQTLANSTTACTSPEICYCVNADYREAIDASVARVRQLIMSHKSEGKAVGYLSIPLSPAGGGSFAVNSEIAAKAAADVTARFGGRSAWLLNP